jgi:hypothetical protein
MCQITSVFSLPHFMPAVASSLVPLCRRPHLTRILLNPQNDKTRSSNYHNNNFNNGGDELLSKYLQGLIEEYLHTRWSSKKS